MIKKQELLDLLKTALDAEEKAIPIYTKHLNTAVFWAGIKKENIQKTKELLEQLANESGKHRNIVENLINRVKTEKINAY